MCFWEKGPHRVTLWFYFLDRNDSVMTLLPFIHLTLWFYVFIEKLIFHDSFTFYSFCFSFHLGVTCYLRVFHLWYRRNWLHSRKPLLYYLVFQEKQLCCENSFIVYLWLQRRMTTPLRPLITLCYSPFFGYLFIWRYFTQSQFSTGLFRWREFMILHAFIKLHVWLLLIHVWCLTC